MIFCDLYWIVDIWVVFPSIWVFFLLFFVNTLADCFTLLLYDNFLLPVGKSIDWTCKEAELPSRFRQKQCQDSRKCHLGHLKVDTLCVDIPPKEQHSATAGSPWWGNVTLTRNICGLNLTLRVFCERPQGRSPPSGQVMWREQWSQGRACSIVSRNIHFLNWCYTIVNTYTPNCNGE